eukprot:scaffold34597_cov177-Amphora_coffeaeformis.AAC.27
MAKLATRQFAFFLFCSISRAFTPRPHSRATVLGSRTIFPEARPSGSALHLADDATGIEELSEERKANLFQFLLRDLQVEGVPLLAVDADQVNTLQAAMWLGLAELCDQPSADKACMVFEDIPVDTLKAFVDDFMLMKTQERIMSVIPELARVSVSLIGKGVGPAILIDVEEAKPEDISTVEVDKPEPQLSAAMKAFYDRMVDKTDAYPYKKNGTPTSFKACRRGDVSHILSSFWNSVCELQANEEDALGSTVLMIPGIDNHERFTVISELLSRSLCLYQGENLFDLVHFFPDYDRSMIYPVEKPAFGHIPPLGWLRSMLRNNGDEEAADQLSDEELALSNYQRRSPMTSVVIKRRSLIDTESKRVVELKLDIGETISASAIHAYAENAKFLAGEGETSLSESLANEKSILE